MRNIHILLLLSVAIFYSCSGKNEKQVNTIYIDIEDSFKKFSPDIFSKIEVISLETRKPSLINRATKVVLNEENEDILIYDQRQYAIFCFDKKGNYKFNSLSKLGNGPEEYAGCYDVVYNPYSHTLDLLDPRGIIIRYDSNMNFVDRMVINNKKEFMAVHVFTPVNENLYLLYNETNEKDDLFFFDKQKNEIIKTIQFSKPFARNPVNSVPFFSYDGTYYFKSSFASNDLYKINIENLTFERTWEIDYSEKNVTTKVVRQYTTFEDFDDILQGGKYALTMTILTNKKFVFIKTVYNYAFYIFLYNKGTQQIIGEKIPFDGYIVPNFQLMTDEALFRIVTSDDTPTIQELMEMQGLDRESKQRLSQIKEDDNPLIVKYYFKK